MSKDLEKYRERYLQAIKTEMAIRSIEYFKDIAEEIGSTDKTLSAISSERQMPTVQHGIDLCLKFGYSANWLFLGKGEQKMKYQASLDEILRYVRRGKRST